MYYSKKRERHICEDCDFEFLDVRQDEKCRLFFSYGRDKNEPIFARIKADLEARGHNVWIDRTRIKAGDNWRRSITDGLVDSSSVLAFLSRHSVRELGVCLDELKIALCIKCGKRMEICWRTQRW